MKTFKGIHPRSSIAVQRGIPGELFVSVVDVRAGEGAGVALNVSEAPAIALAVLEAAHPDRHLVRKTSASYARAEAINWLIAARDRAAQENSEHTRDKRRAEVCKAIGAFFTPRPEDSVLRRAIDRLIDAEDRIIELEAQK